MNQSAGIFFFSKFTKRYLYLLRNDRNSPSWSIPGGKVENNETLLQTLTRECNEEMQFNILNLKLIPIQQFVNREFTYHTFFCLIEKEFIPILNDEHLGYAWVECKSYPKPLHPGLFNTINFEIVQQKLQTIYTNIIPI